MNKTKIIGKKQKKRRTLTQHMMKEKNNAFTLVELLAVIILIGILSLIAIPVVINTVKNSKEVANLQKVTSIIDAGNLYYTQSFQDYDKKDKIENVLDIYNEISLEENKPENGKLYVNENGLVAVSIIIDKKCYIKHFNSGLEINDSDCQLGNISKDKIKPIIEFSYSGQKGSNDWYTGNIYITAKVIDNESGPSKLKWCMTETDCDPTIEINQIEIKPLINEDTLAKKICVIGYDVQANESEKTCSDLVKLDKTKPQFSGINDVTIQKNAFIDLRSGVIVSDTTSGVDGIFTINPTSVDTSKAGTTNVTYSISDLAGNTQTITRKIIVDALAPTVTFTVQGSPINSNGWSKNDFYVKVDINDQSGLGIKEAKWCATQSNTCTPNAIMSGTSMTPLISTQSNNNRICIQATDNNNKTSEVICSDAYKLDKTLPTAGTASFSGTLGSNSWYTSNVTVNTSNGTDSLSGHSGTSSNVTSITSNTSGTTITITTTDLAGNSSTRTYTIKVDKNAPTLTTKTGNFVLEEGDSITINNYFNTPSYSISGGSMTCDSNDSIAIKAGTLNINCTATGGNGLKTVRTATITIQKSTKVFYTTELVHTSNSGYTVTINRYLKEGGTWNKTKITSKSYSKPSGYSETTQGYKVYAVSNTSIYVEELIYDSSYNGRYKKVLSQYNYQNGTWTGSDLRTTSYYRPNASGYDYLGYLTNIEVFPITQDFYYETETTFSASSGIDGDERLMDVYQYKRENGTWNKTKLVEGLHFTDESSNTRLGWTIAIDISAATEDSFYTTELVHTSNSGYTATINRYLKEGGTWNKTKITSKSYSKPSGYSETTQGYKVYAVSNTSIYVEELIYDSSYNGRYKKVLSQYNYQNGAWTGSDLRTTSYYRPNASGYDYLGYLTNIEVFPVTQDFYYETETTFSASSGIDGDERLMDVYQYKRENGTWTKTKLVEGLHFTDESSNTRLGWTIAIDISAP